MAESNDRGKEHLLRIGITDNLRPRPLFNNYIGWLHKVNPSIEFVKLSYHLDNVSELSTCRGLVLTGGGDVHPKFYGKADRIGETEEVNERRDEFEFAVIDRALELELPILGICRGMQIMNVYLGGMLHIDVPTAGFLEHAETNGQENRHDIQVAPETLLRSITARESLTVNSIHHQSIENLGKGLMVSATSPDGVIEAAEWIVKDRMPFLLLVQWHPERMKDFDNPASGKIAEEFLLRVQAYQQ